MARPIKQGLDYFSLDVVLDSKMELFEAEFGLQGFAFIIKLYQLIYGNGYYYEWNEDEQLLFSKKNNISNEQIDVYLTTAFKRNIFNQELYLKYKILTSSGIQKRFFTAVNRRKVVIAVKEYLLIDIKDYEFKDISIVNVNNNLINVDINYDIDELLPTESTQSKVNESKGNESKGNKIILNYTKLDLLFNYLINEEKEFEKLTELDKEIIVRNLKRLDLYFNAVPQYLTPERFLEVKIQYWAIMELYLSPYKIYLDKIKRDDFLFRFLKTKQYVDYSTGTDEDLKHFMGYFIKSLQDELKKNEKK